MLGHSTGSMRYTWNELESLSSSQSCSAIGVGGMNPSPGMLGWRVQVRERFDDTVLTVSDDGGEPLDEHQGMENKGGAAVGSTPERTTCRLKTLPHPGLNILCFVTCSSDHSSLRNFYLPVHLLSMSRTKARGNIRIPPYVSRREQNSCSLRQVFFPILFCLILHNFWVCFTFHEAFQLLMCGYWWEVVLKW